MDVCGLVGALLFFGPPILLCWIGAVVSVRSLRDQPIGLRGTMDALTTGFHVLMIWFTASSLFAGLAGAATWLPFVIWPDAANRLGIPAAVPISAAAFVAWSAATWWLVWPIARDEWRRLTGTESSHDRS